MASTPGATAEQQFAQVLAALNTMQSSQIRDEKHRATEFLEQFQKSVRSPRLYPCVVFDISSSEEEEEGEERDYAAS